MSYCPAHEGELMPCKPCAAITRRMAQPTVSPSAAEADRILAEAQGIVQSKPAPLPEGMLDGPGAPSTSPDPYLCEGIVDRPKWAGTEVPRVQLPAIPVDPIVKAAQEHAQAKKDLAMYESELEQLRSQAVIVKEKIAFAKNEVESTKAALNRAVEADQQ